MTRLFVVGGNGFVGSAVCKAALAKGWNVVSVSSSGRPFRTPKGHAPAWTTSDRISWHSADALAPESYRDLIASCTAAVHTVGILLESQYKGQQGSLAGVANGLLKGWGFATSENPLQPSGPTYERMNRDAAVTVARAFSETHTSGDAPFVMLSAADVMRPLISPRYIETKREAEALITQIAHENAALRPVYLRPGLMYHPHTRPWSTLPATILDAARGMHLLHERLRIPLPTPADILRRVPGGEPIAGALTTPPLHVDTVAAAVVDSVENAQVIGPQDAHDIRRLAGWKE
ncbi:hypothetical protein MCUN1_000682 [Malassezia cuniculi]|uniref:NAD-dependent epimerase/dehydratase domain-containing protein n=1 Tax=Malassezia cuniculi TaxID=948313 RepID=A0AAF0ES48_9BASI|nr:hypothetical protein MCUN1_000682 [Malassezia cuniculi]